MKEKTLIYAVDDEAPIRELYTYALEDAGFAVATFAGAEELYTALSDGRMPDLILLDVMLDGEDGFTILRTLRAREKTQAIPVIMVSAKGEEMDKVRGLNLGADDYLAKPFGVMELLARIRARLRRTETEREECITCHDLTLDDARHEIRIGDTPVSATAKEYALLRTLLLHRGRALTRDFLLDTVWGENYGETRTLDLHIAQIRRLIAPAGVHIRTVRSVGYMLE